MLKNEHYANIKNTKEALYLHQTSSKICRGGKKKQGLEKYMWHAIICKKKNVNPFTGVCKFISKYKHIQPTSKTTVVSRKNRMTRDQKCKGNLFLVFIFVPCEYITYSKVNLKCNFKNDVG